MGTYVLIIMTCTVFLHIVASRCVNITMSAFVIGRNYKQQALLDTAKNVRFNRQWQIL